MTSSHNLNPQQLKAYRDDTVNALNKQINLLREIRKSDLMQNRSIEGKQGLLTIEEIDKAIPAIENEIKKLEHFDVVLSVVGTMKAGKSTTINAIVGREILPNRNRPMTALPTRIIHTPNQKKPVLRFDNPAVSEFATHLGKLLAENPHWRDTPEIKNYDELEKLITVLSQQHKGFKFKESYETEEEIYHFLSELNDLVRLSAMLQRPLNEDHKQQKNDNIRPEDLRFPYEACRNIDQLPTIEIEFSHLKEHDGVEGRLVLLDTPGPNEAGQEHLKPMLEEQLRRSSAVLLVLDYTQLKSEAGERVRLQLEKIPQLEKDRLFALVNKFDQTNANSDDAETTRVMIAGDFLKDRIEKEHIFPVSSQLCYLANRMKDEIAANGKPELGGWVSDFAKEALGTRYEKKWDKEDEEDIADAIIDMREMSRMAEPIDLAIVKTQTEAPQIAMRSALAQIGRLLDGVQDFCQIHTEMAKERTVEEQTKLEEEIEKLNGKIKKLGKLQNSEEKKLTEIGERLLIDLSKKIDSLKQGTKSQYKDFFDGKTKELQQEQSNNTSPEWLLSFLSRAELNERARIKQEAQELLERNQGDEIVLKNEEEKDKFIKYINKIYQILLDFTNKQAIEIVKSGQQEVQVALNSAKMQCEQEFVAIQEGFKEQNITLTLTAPEFSEFEKIREESLSFQREMNQETKDQKYKKSGFWSWLARATGLGGYGKYTVTYFTDSKKQIIEQIEKDLNEQVFVPIEEQAQEKFGDYSSQFINDYIGAVKRQAEQLKQEFDNALNAGKLEGEKKEAYLKFIRLLEKRSAVIKDTLDDCRRIFGRPSEN
ncbi:dynamin family protein [Neisseria bacilliformis]|uniref:dynamin family protein n=1 Tax=Neisseria bacilliformis TaxID=267212 RepID=UPI0028E6860F|nr:dynamin family protein [Neisseria bacilliformis]